MNLDVFENLPPDMPGALCAETDPEVFFPAPRSHGGEPGARAAAKKVCGVCEWRVKCLEWALEREEEHGVYGGLTPGERRRILAKRKRAA